MQTNKIRLFRNSNIYKSTFTFMSLISVLVLSMVILFSIDSVPLSKDLIIKTGHKVSLLFIVWYACNIINKNLHISKHGDIPSYFIALFLNSFLIAIVVFRLDYNPEGINSYIEDYYYFLGLLIIRFLWVVILYFFEKRTRPYFSKYLFWQSLSLLMSIIIFVVAQWTFEHYFINKIKYDYLEISNLLIILFIPIVFLISIFSSIKGYSYITKHATEEKMTLREIIVWNSFVRITSLAIWAIYSIGINTKTFAMYDKLFVGILGICYLTSIVVMIISIIKKHNRFLVYTFTINLIIMSVCGFIFVNVLGSTPSNTFLFFILFIVLFQSMFIILKPKLYKFYPQLNSLLTYLLMVFILLIWTGNKIIGEINFLNINELIWGIVLFISLLMFILYISVELFISIRINYSFAKIIRNKKLQKKRQKMKEVLNG